MGHDPERDAAAYLAGEMSRLRRLRFERHMLECRPCWSEATTGREGRLLAESLRQVASPQARERIRAVIDLSPAPGASYARRPYLLVAGVAALMLVLAITLIPRPAETGQPAPIAAAADLYRAEHLDVADRPAPPVPRIGSYDWRGSTRRDLAGSPATVYSYTDPAGRRILVIASSRPFPRAAGARAIDPAPSWLATVDGVTLLCADRGGLSWLALAADPLTAHTAGQALGLR